MNLVMFNVDLICSSGAVFLTQWGRILYEVASKFVCANGLTRDFLNCQYLKVNKKKQIRKNSQILNWPQKNFEPIIIGKLDLMDIDNHLMI